MAVFRAFKALRPTEEKAAAVAALPYDVVNREEAAAIGRRKSGFFSACRQSGDGSAGRDRSL